MQHSSFSINIHGLQDQQTPSQPFLDINTPFCWLLYKDNASCWAQVWISKSNAVSLPCSWLHSSTSDSLPSLFAMLPSQYLNASVEIPLSSFAWVQLSPPHKWLLWAVFLHQDNSRALGQPQEDISPISIGKAKRADCFKTQFLKPWNFPEEENKH